MTQVWEGYGAADAAKAALEAHIRQLAFELEAFMKMANSHTVLHGGDSAFATARRAVAARLDRAGVTSR